MDSISQSSNRKPVESMVVHSFLLLLILKVLLYRMKYVKNEYSLTYATVKGAGHSIPIYKPEEVWVILDSWLASHSSLSDS
ncbi:hypothetical protein M8C21_005512 [Ambrosia artemisiifolia]|uniref:Uncharacterized protein n=1 Tax=Ambrosia artemisiifolia TaxID=4212 RepID=A0AAD5BYA1_AMBAR|nr:hypothetical protein M8C21_005512 [Ambrosia artemisiifolia]